LQKSYCKSYAIQKLESPLDGGCSKCDLGLLSLLVLFSMIFRRKLCVNIINYNEFKVIIETRFKGNAGIGGPWIGVDLIMDLFQLKNREMFRKSAEDFYMDFDNSLKTSGFDFENSV
jgi:hypothetical protein